MSLNAAEIKLVVEVWNRDLGGGLVRQVISPAAPDKLVIELRTAGENHYLQFGLEPGATRLGRIPAKPGSAERPHPFVMLLRDRLAGMVFKQAAQINADRTVLIDFEARERRGALAVELTSRHANLFWIGAGESIEGSWRPNLSHLRKLVPGEPYVPPISHPYPGGIEVRFEAGEHLEEQIERHYLEWERNKGLQEEIAQTRKFAASAARYLDRLLENLEADLQKAAKSEELALHGHLVKSNLGSIKKGASSVELTDFEGRHVSVALDPSRDALGNMQKLFDRSKKLRRAAPQISKRQTEVEEKRAWIKQILDEIESADTQRLQSISERLSQDFPKLKPRTQSRSHPAGERLPYREYAVSGGRTARVGRSAADNDALTLRYAKPDDLWLHVRGQRGSHVVVPMGRGEDPLSEMLVDAAHLAARFSEAASEDRVEVIYTRRRYVHKPRGAPPGSVTLLREKTLLLKIEKERLERILKGGVIAKVP